MNSQLARRQQPEALVRDDRGFVPLSPANVSRKPATVTRLPDLPDNVAEAVRQATVQGADVKLQISSGPTVVTRPPVYELSISGAQSFAQDEPVWKTILSWGGFLLMAALSLYIVTMAVWQLATIAAIVISGFIAVLWVLYYVLRHQHRTSDGFVLTRH